MLRVPAFLIVTLASFGNAQTLPLTITSAADASTELAAESLATAIGTNLASTTASASSAPWPSTLGGVTMQVIDSGNVNRAAGLLYVSPHQINFQIPAGTALGMAAIFLSSGAQTFSAQVLIRPAAPALFSIDASGIAAATGIRTVLPTQVQSPVPVFMCVELLTGCRLTPIAVGIDTPIYLSFYGTGLHNWSQFADVVVKLGSVSVNAIYAGPQGQFPGLDQVNLGLPLSLRGAGTVDVTVTIGGVTSNAVKINVQ